MHSVFSLLVLAGVVSYTSAYFLNPDILNAAPANVLICRDAIRDNYEAFAAGNQLADRRVNYFRCADGAVLHINRAMLQLSTSQQCPQPWALFPVVIPTTTVACVSNQFVGNNVTSHIINRCDGQKVCNFSFLDLNALFCETPAAPVVPPAAPAAPTLTPVDPRILGLQVEYECIPERARFRPFSNRRYDAKFHATLNHPIRKMSNNHLMAL